MERKGITAGIHWRLAPDWDRAEAICQPVIDRIAAEHSLLSRGGRLAIELFPPITTSKGDGVRRLVETHQLKAVIYLGDEVSDTDAFQEIREARRQNRYQGIAIGIIGKPQTADAVRELADIVIDAPRDTKTFLQSLLRS